MVPCKPKLIFARVRNASKELASSTHMKFVKKYYEEYDSDDEAKNDNCENVTEKNEIRVKCVMDAMNSGSLYLTGRFVFVTRFI